MFYYTYMYTSIPSIRYASHAKYIPQYNNSIQDALHIVPIENEIKHIKKMNIKAVCDH